MSIFHVVGGMKIIRAKPPNFEAIDAAFHLRRVNKRGVLFCWGDAIYNPDNVFVPPELVAHERIHSKQQTSVGGADIWWDRYLSDQQFRLGQEIEAHRDEWHNYMDGNPSRAAKRAYLAFMAERLSGPMYGRMLSKDQAKREITGEADA